MPTRDDQEFEQRRQQIIDGALRVFSSKGFEKATNKDIAQAAGIGSPGLIYHYFKDKQDLFRTLVQERIPALQMIMHGDEFMEMPPREALTHFGKTFVATISNRMAISMLRMLMGEAVRRPEVAQMMSTVGPLPAITFLRRYMEHQMDLGTLRRVDPGIAARTFAGPLIAFALTREFFKLPDAATIDPQEMVTVTVETFLHGMSRSESE
jgi:TetR/AcrR family transcriptional regulator, mexJK operon transcriptional repressor